ncbi:type II toxin-antitoxin system VapC family toxin [Myxococcota bacterium]
MALPRIYVETTIVSYLVAHPSRDLVVAALQQITRDWWDTRDAFDLYVSQLVLDEASAGDADAAARRLVALREATLLQTTGEAASLAQALVQSGGLPPKAAADALHIAVAASHGLDYLLTWNCTHIANATMRGRIESTCRTVGFEPPVICTPVELVEEHAP